MTAIETENKNIIRTAHNKEHPYVMVARKTIENKDLSYEALGLLIYLLSKPDDWQVYENTLYRKRSHRDKVKGLLTELETVGYIHVEQMRDEAGYFSFNCYTVYEEPFAFKGEDDRKPPFTENPSTDNPLTENPHLVINESSVSNDESFADANNEPAKEQGHLEQVVFESLFEEQDAPPESPPKARKLSTYQLILNELAKCFDTTYAEIESSQDNRELAKYRKAASELNELAKAGQFSPDKVKLVHEYVSGLAKLQKWDTFGVAAIPRYVDNWRKTLADMDRLNTELEAKHELNRRIAEHNRQLGLV